MQSTKGTDSRRSYKSRLGAKRVLLCRTYWSTDEWLWAGVEEFPDIEAVQKYMETLNELNWGRYTEATSLLGTKLEI